MDFALLASAVLLGLAGLPHCATMCAAPCAAVVGAPTAAGRMPATVWIFHGARALSYAVAGAVVASSVGALAALGQWSPALRPLWTMLHAAAFALGLWLLWQGRQPAWLENLGRGSRQSAAKTWQPLRGPLRAGAAGSLWVAWPCGLLQSALVIAALANTAAAGAAVMTAFALVTTAALTVGPWLWARVGRGAPAAQATGWAIRVAGAMLAAASGWALTHGLWARFAAYCLS